MIRSNLAPRSPKHLGFRATLGAILGLGIAYVLGCDETTCITAAGMTAFSVRIALIDLKLRIILDRDIIALIGIGTAWVCWTASDPVVAFVDAFLRAIGYAATFQVINLVYGGLRGREGMGLGDIKLVVVAGPLLPLDTFAFAVATAAVGGLAFAMLRLRLKGRRHSRHVFIPFGCFLIVSIFFFWLHSVTY